jgi:malate dehydrogenase (oxaloacetate-decarboxylating)
VAVVGGTGSTAAALRRYADTIEHLAGLRTRVIATDHRLRRLDPEVSAVFLVRADPARALAIRAVLGEVPVVTDHDTAAIALTAAVLTALGRAGRAPHLSQVVIAGARTMPTLSQLLLISGIGDITAWNPSDALTHPLLRIASGADAVINLVGGGGRYAWPRDNVPAVIVPDPARDPLLALPGLLQALLRNAPATPTLDVHRDCALALAQAAPANALLPRTPDQSLVERIADAATPALRRLTGL